MQELNNFRKSLAFVLKWEGGYVNDPDDPGGETKWGISKRNHPTLDIPNLTPEQAAKIYSDEYWDPAGCDSLPFPVCTAVFDTAVNLGVSRAVSWIKQSKDIKEFLDTRKRYYYSTINKNPPSIKYLRGWLNRLNDLQKFVDINMTPIGENLPDMNAPQSPQYSIPVSVDPK